MYTYPSTPAPIEKIRKPQWTVENTRKTQQIVSELRELREGLATIFGTTVAQATIASAIQRFKQLDPGVK